MYLWDLFISHASEDKEAFVKPLVDALSCTGLKVWYDDFTLRPGDPLRRSIDEGILLSRYAVVVLSETYFLKKWPQAELEGLIQCETAERKVLIPIFHDITPEQIARHSPMLASRVGISSAGSLEQVVAAILQVTSSTSVALTPAARLRRPPRINEQKFEWPPRAALVGLASGLLTEGTEGIVFSQQYIESLCTESKATAENTTSFFEDDWPDFVMLAAARAMKPGSISSEKDFDYLVTELPPALTSYLYPMAVSARLISERKDSHVGYGDGVWEEFKTALGQSAVSETGEGSDSVHFIVMQACISVVRVHLLLFLKDAISHQHLLSLFFFIIVATSGDLKNIEETLGPLLTERKTELAAVHEGSPTRKSSR